MVRGILFSLVGSRVSLRRQPPLRRLQVAVDGLLRLRRQVPLPDANALRDAGWTAAQVAAAGRQVARTAAAAERLVAVAGWLATEPAFLRQVEDLRAEWLSLTPPARPRFPLDRGYLADPGSLYGTGGRLAGRLADFLDRWGLTGLSTWDLPMPQGPLLPGPLPADGPANPRHGVYLFVPVHYPLQGDDDLLGRVRQAQRDRAADLGIDPAFGGIANPEAYARMFRLQHLERAVAGRFPGRRPRSLAGHVVPAAAEYLGLSAERVNSLRKAAAACRRGQRERAFRRRAADG